MSSRERGFCLAHKLHVVAVRVPRVLSLSGFLLPADRPQTREFLIIKQKWDMDGEQSQERRMCCVAYWWWAVTTHTHNGQQLQSAHTAAVSLEEANPISPTFVIGLGGYRGGGDNDDGGDDVGAVVCAPLFLLHFSLSLSFPLPCLSRFRSIISGLWALIRGTRIDHTHTHGQGCALRGLRAGESFPLPSAFRRESLP